jgi:signal transduction histidine kinase
MEPGRNADDHLRPRAGEAASVSLLRALLAAFAAVVLLFVVYEAVERMWLAAVDLELLHALRRARVAAAALVAVGVASWLIFREGPPVIAAGMLPGEETRGGAMAKAEKQFHYARWFILMRWIAVVVATIAIFVTVEVAGLLPQHVGPSLGVLIVLLTILNLGYAIYLRHCGAHTALLVVQVYADVVVLILLLHFSGGIENPMTSLLLLHVIIAGIVLGRTHAYLVATTASVLFGAMAWAEGVGLLPHYTLTVFPHHHVDGITLHAAHDLLYVGSRVALHIIVLLLVAYFTTTLVERIRQDESEMEALAASARAQAQMLERALDTTGTALCLCDRDLRPYWSNARWTEWQSAAPELCCGVDAPGSAALATLEDGEVRRTEIRIGALAPVDARVFDVTTAPLCERDGTISHVVTLARDVTEQHAAQARAARAERLAGVGELAGQVAHEVNNPIAIISAKARLLLRDGRHQLPLRAGEEVGKIAELADRVARIAQGLLSYCRPAPGLRQPVDARLPVRRALAYIESRAHAAGVNIVDTMPEQLPVVQANAAELEQVFLNVFLNALDAMPNGGTLAVGARAMSVSAAAAFAATRGTAEGGWAADALRGAVVIEVTDTGTGIDPAFRERVFEPFLTTKGGNGTGLGLSICQGIVRSHGGDISLASEPGRGTRVAISLPATAALAAALAAAVAARTTEETHG